MTTLTLPDAGAGRFWQITHNAKSRTNPLRIALREQLAGTTSRKFSREVGYELTIAQEDNVVEAAKLVLDRAGRVDEFVGDWTGQHRHG